MFRKGRIILSRLLGPHTSLREHVFALNRHDGVVAIDSATNHQDAGMPHVSGAPEIVRPASHLPDSPDRTAARSRWARLLAGI